MSHIHSLDHSNKKTSSEMLTAEVREVRTGPSHLTREPETEQSPHQDMTTVAEASHREQMECTEPRRRESDTNEAGVVRESTFVTLGFGKMDNTRLVTYILFVVSMIWSIAFGSMFDNYLLDVGGSNYFVGVVESIRGLTGLCTALPIGYLGDTYSRRRVIQCTLFITAAAFCGFSIGILYDNVYWVCGGIAFISLSMQSYQSNLQALLADSVPSTEARTRAVSFATTAGVLGSCAGPLLQIILLIFLGNHWHINVLRVLILAGLLLFPLLIPAILSLKDPATQGVSRNQGFDLRREWSNEYVLGIKKSSFVPLLVNFVSLVTAIGAGMTVKFFPLFFRKEYEFTPMEISLLAFAFPVCTASFIQMARGVSGKVGRTQTVFCFKIVGTFFLFMLAYAHHPTWLVVAFFLVRGAFMNCVGALNQSVIMDCVPPHQRGRWSALNSLTRFTWSGSAFIGGLITDKNSYRYTFLVTAAVYCVSNAMYTPLVYIVPKQRGSITTPPQTDPESRMREPVLEEDERFDDCVSVSEERD